MSEKATRIQWRAIAWEQARLDGLLWYINQHLQHVGLSLFMDMASYDPETDVGVVAGVQLGTNPCRGFKDDEKQRQAFSRWLADNAQRSHDEAFPDAEATQISDST